MKNALVTNYYCNEEIIITLHGAYKCYDLNFTWHYQSNCTDN